MAAADGPPPIQHHCLLSALPSCARGDKVRFLGCVCSYDSPTATLTLEHDFPRTGPRSRRRVLVNLDLLRETLGPEQTRVGEWVTVVGYVSSHQGRDEPEAAAAAAVTVQALFLLSAGPFDVGEYERTLARGEIG